MGHGGGTIKFKFEGVMLFAIALAICLAPLSEGLTNQNIDQNVINSEIKNQQVSNANSVVTAATIAQVNAAKKYKKTYKKTYKKYKKTYKKYKKTSKKYRHVKAAYTYRYKVRYTSSGGKGTGDCWTNSEILFKQLAAAGTKVRIIQYPTSSSSRHRSVQIHQNGAWVNYDYKGNGYASRYHATSGSSHGTVIKTS
jgi:hypothetical protein